MLERLADARGSQALTELAAATGLSLPTMHRILRSLVARGYVRQEPSRRYALGPRLIRLGESAGRTLGSWAVPHLTRLAAEIGEAANFAVLEGDAVVYPAQAPSRHAVRMFTEVGRRVQPHSTGVGKVLLAQLPDDAVRAMAARTGLPPQTAHTLQTAEALVAALAEVRAQGYAVDDGEQELGVRCVAVSVPSAPASAAVSVSGPSSRLTEDRVDTIVPVLQRVAAELVGRPAWNHMSSSLPHCGNAFPRRGTLLHAAGHCGRPAFRRSGTLRRIK